MILGLEATASASGTESGRATPRLSADAVAVLDGVQDAVAVLDREECVTFANRRALEHWGLAAPEIVGRKLCDRFPQLRDSPVEVGVHRAMSGVAESCEFISPITNRWIAVSFQPLPNGVSLSWRDITDRMEAARRLHASDEALLMAQEAAGIGTWVWDLRTGGINWSPGMFRLLGIDPETPSSERYAAWLRVLHPEDSATAETEEDRRRNVPPGAFAREFRVVRPDGEIRWVLAQGTVSCDEAGPLVALGFDIDITSRKRMESALRESEARFRQVFDQSPLGMATVGASPAFREVNPALCKMLGYEAGELIGRNYLDLVHPDDRPECRAHGVALVKGLIPRFQVEARYIHKSGATLWVNANVGLVRGSDGQVLYSLAIYEDISERKRMTQALRESQERLRDLNDHLEQEAERRARELAESRARLQALFDTSLDWLALARAESEDRFVCVDMNPALTRALGVSREQVIGRDVAEIKELPQPELYLQHLRECVRMGKPRRFRSHPVVDEAARTVELVLVPVPVQGGEGERLIVVTGRDLTEREALEAQLRQVQKLDAIGQLTGGIAHDFNNLLAAVLGSLELARRRLTDERTLRLLGTATQAAERGAKLTAQLLAFSRKQDLSIRPVEVNSVIRGMQDLLDRTLGPAVSVRLDLAPELWLALADPVQLETVLLNLALNARDAMPEGGTLAIASRNETRSGRERSGEGLQAGDYVVVSVQDTGEGMTEEVRAKAFEPFFTTKEPGKGTGLGLAQVFGFARQAGGTVTLDSVRGRGTTVSVYLPRSAASLAVPSAPPASAPQPAGAHRVLLVDDDEAVRTLARDMLLEAGHAVTAVANGAEVLRLLASAEIYDLLLADFAMPGMNGSELATAARQLRPSLPVLFMTGYVDADALRPWVREGSRILHKPFQSEELARAVAEAVQRGGNAE